MLRGAGIALGIFCWAGTAVASPVSDWLDFRKGETALPQATIGERAKIEQEEFQLRKLAAGEVASLYFARKDLDPIWKLLEQNQAKEALQPNLSDEFLLRTLHILHASRAPAIQKFLELANTEEFGVAFQPPIQGAPEKGGFHRSSGSIYLNLNKLPASEWDLIFVHELLHGIDEQLQQALPIYNDLEFTKKLAKWSRERKESDLTADEKQQIDRWLGAGLDRGLLAEYRVWLVTVHLYLVGRNEALWPRVSWLEDLLKQKKASEPLRHFLFRFLDERFYNPKEGLFRYSLVQLHLRRVRGKIRQQPPELSGRLAEIMKY